MTETIPDRDGKRRANQLLKQTMVSPRPCRSIPTGLFALPNQLPTYRLFFHETFLPLRDVPWLKIWIFRNSLPRPSKPLILIPTQLYLQQTQSLLTLRLLRITRHHVVSAPEGPNQLQLWNPTEQHLRIRSGLTVLPQGIKHPKTLAGQRQKRRLFEGKLH